MTHSFPRAAAVLAFAGLAGCASTQLNSEWKDPQFNGQDYRGQKLMVVCDADEEAVRRICQEQLAAEVTARGGSAEIAPEGSATARSSDLGPVLAAARSAGARGVLSASIAPAAARRSGLSVGIGLGGGIGRSGFGGVGVSAPIATGNPRPSAYAADGRLLDTGSGRVVWTANASTSASGDTAAEMNALARAVLDSAQKAGIL